MSTCRRCAECAGQHHHWLPLPEFDTDGNVVFPCKHCDAFAPACQECFEDIALEGGLCEACAPSKPNVRCVTCRHGPDFHEVDGEELRECTVERCACKQYVCWYKREAEERERLDELRRTGGNG